MIKDGDIFRWRYKDEKPEQLGAWGRYHCKSQFAIAKDGVLTDTYWGSSWSDSARWTYEAARRKLDLTFLGNLADLEKHPEGYANYYDDVDCVNLNHSNSSRGNFYIRKGAKRSRDKMMAVLRERIEETAREVEWKKRRLDEQRATLGLLENGVSVEEIWL